MRFRYYRPWTGTARSLCQLACGSGEPLAESMATVRQVACIHSRSQALVKLGLEAEGDQLAVLVLRGHVEALH